MKVTATLHNLSDNFYADLRSMEPREIYDYLRKLKNDLPHCVKMKIGTGQFRDAVELNQIVRAPCAYAYKLEPRRGYKLATFNIEKAPTKTLNSLSKPQGLRPLLVKAKNASTSHT